MSMFEDTNPHKLDVLLGQIHTREMALPDFQRDFVWEPGATRELIVSIASSYPAGSLLRIRGGGEMFVFREFEGAPAFDTGQPSFLVLDGQQRLTSLYQAFYGVGEHRYYVDMKTLIAGEDFDDAIGYQRANTKRAERLGHLSVQADELMMPLSELLGRKDGFNGWSKDVRRALPISAEEKEALEDQLDRAYTQWIKPIYEYQFPVVTLAADTPADAVCTIFETLNRTGVKLSVFELLTARFWPQGVNLRRLWDEAKDAHPIIDDFAVDPYYVLQSLALASRARPSCKRSDILKLTADDIRTHWETVVGGLADALRILREDCGVIAPQWLPYNTILLPFAAVLAVRPLPRGPDHAAIRAKLVKWFWCSVFGQAYESSPNSQAARDVTAVTAWLDGGPEPETVSDFAFDDRILRRTTPRQRAVYRGTICLTLRNGARDFHSDQPITANLIERNHIDDHHIFPAAWVRRERPDKPAAVADCVLNRTLIGRTTNHLISDRAPSDYMAEVRDARDNADAFDALLESHLIPSGPDSPIWDDDFEGFLARRQAALWERIRAVTGARERADLIEEEAA